MFVGKAYSSEATCLSVTPAAVSPLGTLGTGWLVGWYGEVTRGVEVFVLTEDQSTCIPMNTKHRLSNKTARPLEIIEVQTGSYVGEDDIVRFEDRYGRC